MRSIFEQSASDDHDGLPPHGCEFDPSREQFHSDVRALAGWLRQCETSPADIFWHLGMAFDLLVRLSRKRQPERIPLPLLDELVRAILTAKFAIEKIAPDRAARTLLLAFEGAFILANYLSETDEERAARHPDVIKDARDCVLIAVGCFRNEERAQDIERRAESRRAAVIADLLQPVPKAA